MAKILPVVGSRTTAAPFCVPKASATACCTVWLSVKTTSCPLSFSCPLITSNKLLTGFTTRKSSLSVCASIPYLPILLYPTVWAYNSS